MVEYFCNTRPSTAARRILQSAVALALFGILAGLPASAQNGTGRNNAQAVLHIRINIVPTLMTPSPSTEQRPPLNGVSYNFSTMKSDVETIEETRPLSDQTGKGQGAILKTLTIVSR